MEVGRGRLIYQGLEYLVALSRLRQATWVLKRREWKHLHRKQCSRRDVLLGLVLRVLRLELSFLAIVEGNFTVQSKQCSQENGGSGGCCTSIK